MLCAFAAIVVLPELPDTFFVPSAAKSIRCMTTHLSRLFALCFVFIPVLLSGMTFEYAETDPIGRFYLLSARNGIIVRLSSEETLKRGDGPALMSRLQEPAGLQLQFPSSVWVLDRTGKTILEFDTDLNYLGSLALSSQIEDPIAFLILSDGSWLLADALNQKIWQFNPGFSTPVPWGTGRVFAVIPPDLSLMSDGNKVYCFSPAESIVWIADTQGRLRQSFQIPDSLGIQHLAGGWKDFVFLSGPKGTWMLSPGISPKKIDDKSCLRIWKNRRIRPDGSSIPGGFDLYLPKGTSTP
ncbi:TPA: hypothetical protein DCG86_03970 [Candidatus Marinimicrobia bacterium]|nr:hypothetical protein [Candidatus Neomarinimicrobiota bacterium]